MGRHQMQGDRRVRDEFEALQVERNVIEMSGGRFTITTPDVDTAAVDVATTSVTPISSQQIVVVDTFNRADGAVGDAEAGGTWTVFGDIAISSNTVVIQDGSHMLIDSGLANMEMEVTWVAKGFISYGAIIPRWVDGDNHIQVQATRIGHVTGPGGPFTEVASYAAIAAGSVVRVVTSGSSIKVYDDDVLVADVTITQHQSATVQGLIHGVNYSSTWDDLRIAGTVVGPTELVQVEPSQSDYNGGANVFGRQRFKYKSVITVAAGTNAIDLSPHPSYMEGLSFFSTDTDWAASEWYFREPGLYSMAFVANRTGTPPSIVEFYADVSKTAPEAAWGMRTSSSFSRTIYNATGPSPVVQAAFNLTDWFEADDGIILRSFGPAGMSNLTGVNITVCFVKII
jgi:hypothetical protein